MKNWTYLEQKNKVIGDLDLQDESFIQPDEMIGYFNEAITEAEAEIHDTREDYFLKSFYLPCAVNQDTYSLPGDIFANKIRGFVYSNSTIIYDIKRIRTWHEFNQIAMTASFGPNDDYRSYITNAGPGQTKLILSPKSRETAILPQISPASQFTPMILWYLRNAQRIPIHGEYIVDWETFILPANVNIATDVITLVQTLYVTGDQVMLAPFPAPGGVLGLPAPLKVNTVYFVITTGTAGQIKLATTLANAVAGTAIDITTTGSATGYFNVYVAATDTYINQMIVDIPEFATFVMQYVKCRCFEKEGDPRLTGATATLEQQRMQMVSTLQEMYVDNDNEIQADFTHYQEMS